MPIILSTVGTYYWQSIYFQKQSKLDRTRKVIIIKHMTPTASTKGPMHVDIDTQLNFDNYSVGNIIDTVYMLLVRYQKKIEGLTNVVLADH